MRIQMIDPQISENATTARISEIAPAINENTILVQDGENLRRSWGCVKVTSTVVLKTRTFCAVHVGVSHKYRGTQGWFYFQQPAGEEIKRLTASQLSPRRRKQVLAAYEARKAPSWAKRPFESERAKPSPPERHTRYKAVAIENDKFFSIYDGSEYVLGKTRREKSQPDHNGGFYVYRRPELALEAEVPNNAVNHDLPRAILKCEVWGNCEAYGDKAGHWDVDFDRYIPDPQRKEAWTYLKPLEIVQA